MDKYFDHAKEEKNLYALWEKSDAFKPKIEKGKKPFCIIMPPPNANDNLHVGHARFITIEDILIRYHRMKGDPTLWLPAADHAGIETQYVFEKKLKKEGKSRLDFDRNTLYRMIWDFVNDNKANMENQLRSLGSSCDWSRNKFTLDPDIVKVVYKTFKKLHDDQLLYRGERIVNYCPRCGTAYSQLEVDSVEREDDLYFLDYGSIKIATTRPETIFADVAIAVNPKDKRYEKLIGKKAIIPLIKREIPIIADSLVDIKFGTGALKITPGHDATDFEIGQNHHLSVVSVIDASGRIINAPEKYVGLKAEQARELVVNDLREKNLLLKTEKIKHVVGLCYKDKGLIEPMVSKQWFIKIKPLADAALKAIDDNSVSFPVARYEKIAKHWLKNLKDWNISRQIVWGIRIPAFRCEKCLEWTITDGATPDQCEHCGNKVLTQDPDTFDTWFSSGQWPFATLQTGQKGDFDYFYPTSVMETAYDILPFWVIRMIMLGLYATGEVPFKEVVIHGLVRDKEGQKISKSKGNVINPLEMSDKYGTDALRMGIIWGALIENDVCLSEDNIRGQRNFANKIWNIGRFVFANKDKKTKENNDDKWIKEELAKTVSEVSKALEQYRLSEAAEDLYDFIWHKLADTYIEKIKDRREEAQETLEEVYRQVLKLTHPFMPYVTEAVWQIGFSKENDKLLINSSWPKG
jgi:valyl-tRNA synthetase